MSEAKTVAPAATQHRLEPGRFTIVMEGGNVKAVVSNDPALIGAKFSTLDYDIEDVDPVWSIIQSDNSVYPAGGYTSTVEAPGIDLDHIFEDPDSAFIEDKT
ncbi:MAG TPA: hypothetical protein VF292_03875 [Rhodanobacteraceae bacterium]